MINVEERIKDKIHINAKTSEIIIEILLGFILTRCTLFSSVLPLGISFSIANVKKNNRIYALIGGFFGYLLMNDAVYGFRYAGITLIIASIINLSKINIYAVIAIIMPMFGAFDFFSNQMSQQTFLLILCEVIVCLTGTFLYIKFLEKEKKYKKVCLLFFLATIISALSGVTIFFDIAIIRIFAVLIILVATYFGKSGTGCIVSVVFGIVIDGAMATNSTIFTIAYSFATVIAGTLSNMSKMLFSSVFIAMYGICAIFGDNQAIFIASFFEVLVASVMFIIIPNNRFLFMKNLLRDSAVLYGISNDKVFGITNSTSNILNHMSKILTEGIEQVPDMSYSDINKVYYATTEKICKNCEISHICWTSEYISSIDALNSATSKALIRGYFLSTDFPMHFSTKCIKFVDFLNEVNNGAMSINQNKQINETLQSNKRAISSQCTAISAIIKDITYSVVDPIESFPEFEHEIQFQMNKYTLSVSVLAYNNSAGKFFVEIIGKNVFALVKNLKEVCKTISKIVNRQMEFMSQSNENGTSRVVFSEKNLFKLEVASKNISKHSVSGDVLEIFDNGVGCNFVVLSDGMGSGYIANEESLQVVNLLSKMLKSSVSLPKALKGIGPLVCIKNDDKNFVALDVLSIDLNNLEGVLAKYGATPTYILRANQVHKISSTNLPLGLGFKSEISRMQFRNGDIVLMMSDGILNTENDDFLVEILKNSKDNSCQEICEEIILQSFNDDDKTVIVLKIKLNK